jgi:hypothetical protein
MTSTDIIITRRDDGALYDVAYGDLFSNHLGKDEALGVVASILFGEEPIYLRSSAFREIALIRRAESLANYDSETLATEIADQRLSQEAVSRVMAAIDARREAA